MHKISRRGRSVAQR